MLQELEEYAKENKIPIMLPDGIEYLCELIKEEKIRNILEIGSAIGYSSIKMALIDKDIKITTIEKDSNRYEIAKENIKKFNLDEQINIINADALTITIDDTFDLIFIDASKSHNIDFFNKYLVNLTKCGIIVTDNLSFHGLVEDESLIKTKNQRSLVKKIKDFILFLDNNQQFKTIYINKGDKISVSRRV